MLFGPPLTILILSPQPWVGLQVSKHHYAREMAAIGHRVIFANPPGGRADFRLASAGGEDAAITLLDHPPLALPWSKFHARWLFDRLMARRARTMQKTIGPVDLLWDFDNARQFADHRWFGARTSILHVVDRLNDGDVSDRNADLVLSVDPSLVADLLPAARARHVIGHGLSPLFAAVARQRLEQPRRWQPGSPVTIGFIGNLAQPAMDRDAIAQLVTQFPECAFRFIGPVQGRTDDIARWVSALADHKNVAMPGLLTGAALIEAAEPVDIWLLCYDRHRDRNQGVNSHKLLEYFALGGEVVSSPISAHRATPGVFMVGNGAGDSIAEQLRGAIAAVKANKNTGGRARIELALANSYRRNVETINALLPEAGENG